MKSKENKENKESKENSNVKTYKILSYIGFLWLIGLFVKEKNDKKLRFHVGQGIILSIASFCASFVVSLFNNLVVANIFRKEVYIFGIPSGNYVVNGVGIAIQTLLNLALVALVIYYIVVGILNVIHQEEKELPFIGKYAFYK